MSLETLQKKYNFSEDLFHLSRKQIKMKMTSNTLIDDMESFLAVFPKNLRNDLQISMYGERLGQIDIFHGLTEETIISIGRKLTKIIYLKGTSSFAQIQNYLLAGTHLLENYRLFIPKSRITFIFKTNIYIKKSSFSTTYQFLPYGLTKLSLYSYNITISYLLTKL